MRVFLGVVIMASLLAQPVQASDRETSQAPFQLADAFSLPQVPGLSGPSADWRQWDSFFTFVVKRFGQDVPATLKDSVGEAFLDSRYELTSAIAPGQSGNPVPDLFLNGWQRLSPIMNQALPGLAAPTASRYASFISAADKLTVLGKQGAQLGLLQLSPDALRGMARLLEPSAAGDPLAYSTSVDTGLRDLLGFGSPLPASGRGQSWLPRLRLPDGQAATGLSAWLLPEASAAERPAGNQWVPDEKQLPAYLLRVRSLLVEASDRVAAKNKLADQYKLLYRQIVFAAAWQETCWRQFVKRGTNVSPMTSATGDLGLMQVNRNTWRGVYDLTGLTGDIAYNGNSGSEPSAQKGRRRLLGKIPDRQFRS